VLGVGDEDGQVLLYDLPSGYLLRRIVAHMGSTQSIALGRQYVASGGRDGRVLLTLLDGGEPAEVVRHDSSVTSIALGGRHMASGSHDGRVLLTPLDDGVPEALPVVIAGDYSIRLTINRYLLMIHTPSETLFWHVHRRAHLASLLHLREG